MGIHTVKASVFYRTNAKIRSIAGYGALLARNLNGFLPSDSDSSSTRLEKELNPLLAGYPRNHNYRIYKKKLFPSFKLYERFRLVASLYPEKLESFLDIGSCRGFYAMDAAQRPNCRISAGVDVHEPFISISNKVREYLDIKNVDFHFATLDELSSRPESYGGPFQTVLLINVLSFSIELINAVLTKDRLWKKKFLVIIYF